MPEFKYKGVSRSGDKVSGTINVSSEMDVRTQLRLQGVRPTEIKKNKESVDLKSFFVANVLTIPSEDLVSFTRQLQVLISSGIPLVQGLDILSEQLSKNKLKTIISSLKSKISEGSYLWEALSMYPSVFPKLYIALIRAGEASGAMDQILKRISRYLEDSERLKKMVKSVMMYPIIVVSIGFLVIGLMMVFVIPKFEELLASGHQELPLPTKLVVNFSHFFQDNIFIIIIVIFSFFYTLKKYFKSEEGKAVLDQAIFYSPIFGNIVRKSSVARFSRTLQTLLSSGVNLIDAIDICKSTIDNIILENAILKIRSEIESGKTLGLVINKLNVFPSMAVQMINVGEATGNLDKMLEKVADFFEEEVETAVNGLSKLIEPLVLVFLGGAIGGMMIAMFLPMFKIAGSVE